MAEGFDWLNDIDNAWPKWGELLELLNSCINSSNFYNIMEFIFT